MLHNFTLALTETSTPISGFRMEIGVEIGGVQNVPAEVRLGSLWSCGSLSHMPTERCHSVSSTLKPKAFNHNSCERTLASKSANPVAVGVKCRPAGIAEFREDERLDWPYLGREWRCVAPAENREAPATNPADSVTP